MGTQYGRKPPLQQKKKQHRVQIRNKSIGDSLHLFYHIYMLGNFDPEWLRNGPELLGSGPKHLTITSGAFLGKRVFEDPDILKRIDFCKLICVDCFLQKLPTYGTSGRSA